MTENIIGHKAMALFDDLVDGLRILRRDQTSIVFCIKEMLQAVIRKQQRHLWKSSRTLLNPKGLFRKTMLSRTYKTEEKKALPGHKLSHPLILC